MKVTVNRWLTEPRHDIRREMTTVTIATCAITAAVTLHGRITRKQAIKQAYHNLVHENTHGTSRWSCEFLNELWGKA